MSQAGYTPILIYNSTTAAAVPVNTNLANGELAINITDGKLYYKDNTGTVRLLADNAVTTPVTSITFASTGLTPSTATSGAVTVGGTLVVANGGTGLTTLATGALTYGAGTSAHAPLLIGTANQILTVNSGATAPQWSTLSGVAVTTIGFGTTGLTPSAATSGIVTVAGTLAVTNGGTGNVTANAAFNALAPSQTSANGQYLTSNGTNTSWASVVAGATLSNDTATASTLYPMFAAATSGVPTTVYTSNAKYLYKPSTGELSVTTPIALNGLFVNATTLVSSCTIASGQSASSVGGTSGFTIPGVLSVTISSGSRWVIL